MKGIFCCVFMYAWLRSWRFESSKANHTDCNFSSPDYIDYSHPITYHLTITKTTTAAMTIAIATTTRRQTQTVDHMRFRFFGCIGRDTGSQVSKQPESQCIYRLGLHWIAVGVLSPPNAIYFDPLSNPFKTATNIRRFTLQQIHDVILTSSLHPNTVGNKTEDNHWSSRSLGWNYLLS